MDQETIVYGVIKTVSSESPTETRRMMASNKQAIHSLVVDDEFPYLTKEMFGLPGFFPEHGTYFTPVVHFAASYRAVEYQWEEWLQKFEALLRRMYWRQVTVHLQTELSGTHTFHWESQGDYHQPGQEHLELRCEWEHELNL